jgi:hypothetical protein
MSRIDIEPRKLARIAGVLYLIIIVLGLLTELVIRAKVVVPGDPIATAANLRASESLWRVGITFDYVMLICSLGVLPILYLLLRPVSEWLAFTAAGFNLVGIAVQAVAVMQLWAALFPLGSADYAGAFEAGQLGALAALTIRWHTYGYGVALLFFGAFCVLIGILIQRSGYMPKWIGVLMQIAGVCYVFNTLMHILAPAIAGKIFMAIMFPCFVAETSLTVWLLAKGVNEEKWRARIAAQ